MSSTLTRCMRGTMIECHHSSINYPCSYCMDEYVYKLEATLKECKRALREADKIRGTTTHKELIAKVNKLLR